MQTALTAHFYHCDLHVIEKNNQQELYISTKVGNTVHTHFFDWHGKIRNVTATAVMSLPDHPAVVSYSTLNQQQTLVMAVTNFSTGSVQCYQLDKDKMTWQPYVKEFKIDMQLRSHVNTLPFTQLLSCTLNDQQGILHVSQEVNKNVCLNRFDLLTEQWQSTRTAYDDIDHHMRVEAVTVNKDHQELVLLPSRMSNHLRHLVCFEPYLPRWSMDFQQWILDTLTQLKAATKEGNLKIAPVGEPAQQLLVCDRLLSELLKPKLPVALMQSGNWAGSEENQEEVRACKGWSLM